MLLTNAQVSRLCRAIENNFSANVELSTTQLHKTGQSGGFLVWLLEPLLKSGLLLIKNVLKTLAKSVLIPLGLTAVASATHAAIHIKMFGSGITTLIISNKEINYIMQIVKFLEEFGLLMKGVCETIKSEAIKQKERFLGMLLGTIRADQNF